MVTKSPFITEAWVEYGLSITVVLIRVFARWKLMGFKGFGGDDYLCILAALFWTSEIVIVYLVGRVYGSNTGWTSQERSNFSEAEIKRMATGSKLVIVGWFMYVSIIWSLKGSVLFYYERLTSGIFQRKTVRLSAIVCCLSYVVVVFTIAFHCQPFHLNWQVNPDPGRECSMHYSAYPVVAAFNILYATSATDMIIIAIPIPILIKLRIKLIRKLTIGALLCSGIFIMVSALLRCVLSLVNIKNINVAAIWAARESFVAFVAVNAPIIKPLFNTSTWVSASRLTDSSHQHTPSTNTNKKKQPPSTRDEQYELGYVNSASQPPQYGYTSDVSNSFAQAVGDSVRVTTDYQVTHIERV
ncbi:hypothetical protein BGW36DRAFT_423441 [Talaromyces proteolyticus]|uniref:Rhodopsin domain-containing protein n=1 Tax=Talaromyces proteolyticus TaxID=1131652 RepID=A0AAD4L0C2_9EURO|nr:uncharacterized protein BGW36DRAFT_423441 [Talaromyces proteolyticus]KAH8703898.1 hypothetical protein BGW36DRAFT_423441 [Talaromyces proteolyticus]